MTGLMMVLSQLMTLINIVVLHCEFKSWKKRSSKAELESDAQPYEQPLLMVFLTTMDSEQMDLSNILNNIFQLCLYHQPHPSAYVE
ncbi:hypothetical protein KY285_020750 [Solanum tuberosum]|nr:hypothetical protein KY285_020750 [Solanum tuberosum]